MNIDDILSELRQNLSDYLIEQVCKADDGRVTNLEIYKYKKLTISEGRVSKSGEKTVAIRIGVFLAEFVIGSCEKVSGCLDPDAERFIINWMAKNENSFYLKAIFDSRVKQDEFAIIPFDLEEVYSKFKKV